MAKWCDLHGNGEAGPESVAKLGLIHDNDELIRADLHHLLTEEGSTAALYEVQFGIDLVRAVNGNVQFRVGVERDERDAKLLGLFLCSDRGGDGYNVLQRAVLQELTKALHSEVSGRARAQADNHARLDVVVDRFVSHLLLQFVLGFGHVEGGQGARCKGGAGVDSNRGRECRSGGCRESKSSSEETHDVSSGWFPLRTQESLPRKK
mmetsp:Transcript_42099/g.77918  ORF Transcript_42099/g.77918 Transcript_42099/m.77918 type:complete len:207 (+) Transcript_42099:429-1049(+)